MARDLPHWPGEYFAKPPIIVLSFNRPHYLGPTLESLRRQRPDIDPDRIHLFQDGAVNLYSGVRYADDAGVEACIRLFRQAFPRGHVHASAPNIGICENFLRAERFAFLTLKAPVAYFFEDDLVLSPNYVSALDVLRRALCGRRVGYFNACGSFASGLAEQTARQDELIDMGHLWGFGLKRSHWRAMQDKLEPYYRLVAGRDYRDRPHDAIRAFYRTLGISQAASSQDAAKTIVSQALGSWQASTFACFAQYIGRQGTHFTEATFERLGLHKTTLFPGALHRVRVSHARVKSGLKHRQRVYRRFYRDQIRSARKMHPAAQPD
ncbi:MAG TPA: glycosyltransferase family A protein [Dongiaceae bacterium]|nr:glycosyltransferase family A protein [Dongiaceae bacterium]